MPDVVLGEHMQETMTFFEALQRVVSGQRITRLDWDDRAWWGMLLDGRLCIHKPDGQYHAWIVSDGDMLAEDWIIWEP